MRIGRWMITVGLLTIVVFWLLPTVAFLPLGGWVSVIGIVLATGDWLVLPAAILTAAGITIVVLGRAGEAETRRRNLAAIPQQLGRASRPSPPQLTDSTTGGLVAVAAEHEQRRGARAVVGHRASGVPEPAAARHRERALVLGPGPEPQGRPVAASRSTSRRGARPHACTTPRPRASAASQ